MIALKNKSLNQRNTTRLIYNHNIFFLISYQFFDVSFRMWIGKKQVLSNVDIPGDFCKSRFLSIWEGASRMVVRCKRWWNAEWSNVGSNSWNCQVITIIFYFHMIPGLHMFSVMIFKFKISQIWLLSSLKSFPMKPPTKKWMSNHSFPSAVLLFAASRMAETKLGPVKTSSSSCR